MRKPIQHFCAALILCCLIATGAEATHNRAGEITYEQIDALTIRARITTYTKISGQSIHADRSELELIWGDGSSDVVPRTNFVMVHPDIRQNEYIYTHTYAGPNLPGQPYIMRMQDPNRNEDILNVNGGNSVNLEFYLQTEVYLFPTSIYGTNHSPVLLEPPIDFGVVGQVFQHTPNGYDPDGDSIAYELIMPAVDVGVPVPGYQPVSDIMPGPNNQFTFDVHTGLFTWTTPQKAGEYNIAILVKSYRNRQYLGGIVRDIQIEIRDAQNTPPIIEAEEEICVWAGETIDFDVLAYDNDQPLQTVTLTATGGVFQLASSPANFTGLSQGNPVSRNFYWQTDCSHIQKLPYQVVFKARDTFSLGGTPPIDASLATFKVLNIQVVAPPPQNLQADVVGGAVTLTWDAPYICEGAPGFFGFTVWRKESCDPFEPDSCDVGLDGHGYTILNLGNMVTTPSGGKYTYIDNTVERGALYSYRILGEFGTPIYSGGNIINFHNPVSSVTSDEICVRMARDLPLMTNVDILSTDGATGEIFVQWSKPNAEELDTIQNIPPYRYELYRSDDMNGNNFGSTPIFVSPNYSSFWAAVDTFFTDTNRNTEGTPYSYKVAFYTNGDMLGYTNVASSVFLTVASTDETNVLSWSENVPWTNTEYVVYWENPTGSGTFVVLDTVSSPSYTHTGLVNGSEYCYYVQSIGSYGLGGVLSPLLNRSQRACGTPLDTIAPCSPVGIAQISGCNNVPETTPSSDLFNTITWRNGDDTCSFDVAKFRVYFAPFCDGNYTLVAESQGLNDTFLLHQPSPINLAGCYYVTAIDSVEANGGGNESAASEIVQTDNCPIYRLPNVFTPNDDTRNDFFTPFRPFRYIEKVEFKVFNRWGQVLFETEDPTLGWDGRDMLTEKLVSEGVYYYTCIVTESRIIPQVYQLCGYIHVMYGGTR